MNDAIQPPNRPIQRSVNPKKDTTEAGNKGQTGYGGFQLYRRKENGDIGDEIDRETVNGPGDMKPACDRLLDRNRSVCDSILYFTPDVGFLVQQVPAQSELLSYMTEELERTLSASDYKNFREYGLAVPNEASRRLIHTVIDKLILQAAVDIGPSMFLLPQILQRVTEWLTEVDGGERWKKLGKQFALVSRKARGEGRKPLSTWWDRSRKKTIVREVRVLKRYLRAKLTNRRSLSKLDLVDAMLNTIGDHANEFPKLMQIGNAFQSFVESDTEPLRILLDGTLSPANFTGELMELVTGYTPESAIDITSRREPPPGSES